MKQPDPPPDADLYRAERHWRPADERGDGWALNALGNILHGEGKARRDEGSLQEAQAGHPGAMYDLGYRHYQRGELAEAEH